MKIWLYARILTMMVSKRRKICFVVILLCVIFKYFILQCFFYSKIFHWADAGNTIPLSTTLSWHSNELHTEDVITTTTSPKLAVCFWSFVGTDSEQFKLWNKHSSPSEGKELPAAPVRHRGEHFMAAHESSSRYLCAPSLWVTTTSLIKPWSLQHALPLWFSLSNKLKLVITWSLAST